MNNKEIECLYRESDYYKELYNISLKNSISNNFIANSLNRFLIKNRYTCTNENFDKIISSLKNSIC